jgi:acid phosphatase type 7
LKGGQVVFAATARAPKSAGQAYRFVAFGDCGAGSKDQKPLARRAFVSQPDFVMIPGDIVYDRGLIVDYRKKFWPVYNADGPGEAGVPLIRSVPFMAAPGNHDLATRDLDKYPDSLAYYLFWDQPLNGPIGAEGGPLVPALTASDANRRAFMEAAGDAYPRMANFSFDYGNAHWTILDSNPYVNWTDPDLKSWVASDLAGAQNATWRFVTFHHPGFNSSRAHYEDQQMRLLAPVFEAGKVDIVFAGHVHNYQRSFPLKFKPDNNGTLLVGGRDNKAVRGRLVNGQWQLDKSFDGRTDTTPNGIIYVITGAGGQHLYNPEQTGDPDSWQKFTDKFFSTVYSLTVADVDGKTLTIRQVAADGQELDHFTITK